MGLIRGLLFDNLGIKLVALLLAVIVYLHVYTERPATMMLAFPLELTEIADSLTLSGSPPPPVNAELRGTGKSLIRLRLTEPRIKVSLANAEPGRFERRLAIEDLPLIPSDRLEVTRFAGPTLVDLRIERKVSRRVPVAARVEGELPEGVSVAGHPTADPPALMVTGPASVVARMDSVRLQAIRVDGRRDTVREQAEPAEVPEWCSVAPGVVEVTVAVAREPAGGR